MVDTTTRDITHAAWAVLTVGKWRGKVLVHILPRCVKPLVIGMDALQRITGSGKIRVKAQKAESAAMTAVLKPMPQTPFDASVIPEQFREYAELFDPAKADNYPPKRGNLDVKLRFTGEEMKTPYRRNKYNNDEKAAMDNVLDTNLPSGKVVRATGAADPAPVTFVRDEAQPGKPIVRVAYDLRCRNDTIKQDAYSLPTVEDVMETMAGMAVFCKFDVSKAYNCIRLADQESIDATAFSTHRGVFKWTVLPFGVKVGSAAMQRLMDEMLSGLKGAAAYQDDIIVGGRNKEELVANTRAVLERVRKFQLPLKLSKSVFFKESVPLLGYVLSDKGIATTQSAVEAMVNFPVPRTRKHVRSFIGAVGHVSNWIKRFAELRAPLDQLLKKDVKFVWTEECQTAFRRIKEALTTTPVLRLPRREEVFVCEADASDIGVGAVLYNMKPGGNPTDMTQLKLVGYYSKRLSSAERNYSTTEKELLAIVLALRRWRHLLTGTKHKVIFKSDHKNLVNYNRLEAKKYRVVRWVEELSQCDFRIVFTPGVAQPMADCLSRSPDFEGSIQGEETPKVFTPAQLSQAGVAVAAAATSTLTGEDVPETATTDGSIESLIRTQSITHPPEPKVQKLLNLTLTDGLWRDMRKRIYVPEGECRRLVVAECHDSKGAGHGGKYRTSLRVKLTHVWHNMTEYIEKYVTGCTLCQQNKPSRTKQAGWNAPIEVPSGVWQDVAIDLVTDLVPSKDYHGRKFDAVLTAQCLLSKQVHLIPFCKESSSEMVAKALMARVFAYHGLPNTLLHDRDQRFVAGHMANVCKLLGIRQRASTSFHPNTNGSLERQHAVMAQVLRNYVNHSHDNWVDLLPWTEVAMNSSVNASTQKTPFMASQGFEARTSWQITPPERESELDEHVAFMQAVVGDTKEELARANKLNSAKVNKHRSPAPVYSVGDSVWLDTRQLRLETVATKFNPTYIGPFEVLDADSHTVKLQLPKFMKHHPRFHVSRVKAVGADGITGRPVSEPRPIHMKGESYYQAEKIVDSFVEGKQLWYKVKWTGVDEPTNEPWEVFGERHRMTDAFHELFPDKPSRESVQRKKR